MFINHKCDKTITKIRKVQKLTQSAYFKLLSARKPKVIIVLLWNLPSSVHS